MISFIVFPVLYHIFMMLHIESRMKTVNPLMLSIRLPKWLSHGHVLVTYSYRLNGNLSASISIQSGFWLARRRIPHREISTNPASNAYSTGVLSSIFYLSPNIHPMVTGLCSESKLLVCFQGGLFPRRRLHKWQGFRCAARAEVLGSDLPLAPRTHRSPFSTHPTPA